MPPPVGLRVEEPRLPHPRSLAPLADVFPDGTSARSELAAARRLKLVVPPAAHRRTPKSPLEVRIRANVIALLDIDAVQQTFTAHFFLDATWVRPGRRRATCRTPRFCGSRVRPRMTLARARRSTPACPATSSSSRGRRP